MSVAENIRNFKVKMLQKRGLIAHHGEIKMNKVKAKTLERQAKIKKFLTFTKMARNDKPGQESV